MKPKMRMVQVCKVEALSPHMRRITFKGDDLDDFPLDHESGHVKVTIPEPGNQKPKKNYIFSTKKWTRSYTIRHFDHELKLLVIDFAVSDHQGTLTDWASKTTPGDYVGIRGPGSIKHTDFEADWHLILGDFTALPAIAATVEKLPKDAKGYVVIQIPADEDKQTMSTPDNINLQWIVNVDFTQNKLLKTLEKLEWKEGKPAIFIAGEASQMKSMLNFVKTKPSYQRKKTYASAYWKVKK